jgi:hypothetical protein
MPGNVFRGGKIQTGFSYKLYEKDDLYLPQDRFRFLEGKNTKVSKGVQYFSEGFKLEY